MQIYSINFNVDVIFSTKFKRNDIILFLKEALV